jgi:hypothetical protein
LKCINCGKEASELHHVVPLSLGGNDIDSNKVPLCSLCHTIIHGTNPSKRGTHWKELQKAGIEKAKAEGKYKGRKPREYDKALFARMCQERHAGKRTAASIQRHFGITAQTFYRWEKECVSNYVELVNID